MTATGDNTRKCGAKKKSVVAPMIAGPVIIAGGFMGTIEFKFESDHFAKDGECAQIEVSIDVSGSEDEGGTIESMEIWDETNKCSRFLGEFPEDEQRKLQDKAQSVADEKAYDIWMEDCITMAEYASEGDR